MSGYAGSEPSIGFPSTEHGPSSAEFLADKARYAAQVVDDVGAGNALMLGWSRLFRGRMAVDIEVDTAVLREPLRMSTTPSDYRCFNEIINRGVYELPAVLDESVDGQPVLDIGAYVGMASAYFASRYPHSPVLAFEPAERNYRLLAANTDRYDGQIEPARAAVVPEHVPIRVDQLGADSHNYWRHRYSGLADGDSEVISAIAAVTPADILQKLDGRRVGLLKVDIEGAEKELFDSGAADELLAVSGVFMAEAHDWLVPGCRAAIQEAAARTGLRAAQSHDAHSMLYVNPAA